MERWQEKSERGLDSRSTFQKLSNIIAEIISHFMSSEEHCELLFLQLKLSRVCWIGFCPECVDVCAVIQIHILSLNDSSYRLLGNYKELLDWPSLSSKVNDKKRRKGRDFWIIAQIRAAAHVGAPVRKREKLLQVQWNFCGNWKTSQLFLPDVD